MASAAAKAAKHSDHKAMSVMSPRLGRFAWQHSTRAASCRQVSGSSSHISTYSNAQILRINFAGIAVNPGMLVTPTAPTPVEGIGATEPLGCPVGSWLKAAVARTSRLPLVGVNVGINEGHVMPDSRPRAPTTGGKVHIP